MNLYNNIQKYICELNLNKIIKKIGINPMEDEKEFELSIFENKYFLQLIKECLVNKNCEM